MKYGDAKHEDQPAQLSRWARSPKFMLRMDVVRRVTAAWTKGDLLEVGAGTGEMTELFLQRGYSASLYDLGDSTRDALRTRFFNDPCVRILDELDQLPQESVDYLLAFEVLEHIIDDAGALSHWATKLRAGGKVIISVPAHEKKFGYTDKRVGHVRRYEQRSLFQLFKSSGFSDISIYCYGFPLGNITRLIGELLDAYRGEPLALTAEERSVRSGTSQSTAVVELSRYLRDWMYVPFFMLQRATLTTDWGDGYVLTARRSPRQGELT